jgi:hypothetical protein
MIKIKTIYGNCHYPRVNIVRNNQLYKWYSPKHEWLGATIDTSYNYYHNFILFARQEGGASKDPNRCINDAVMFRDYINENGGFQNCGREVFYLAREYRTFNIQKAIKYYKIKLSLSNQWIQEMYISYLELGRICKDEYFKLKYWKKGFKLIPRRLECIYEIVKYYKDKNKFDCGLKFACLASECRTYDINDLFIESSTYDHVFDLDYSICAHYNGQHELASFINQKNMTRNKGKPIMDLLLKNQGFFIQHIAKDKLMNFQCSLVN